MERALVWCPGPRQLLRPKQALTWNSTTDFEGRASQEILDLTSLEPAVRRPPLADLRCARKWGFAFAADAGDVCEYRPDNVHPVVHVEAIHHWHGQQGHAPIGSVSRSAGKPGHGRAHQEVRKRPFIARGPDLP